MRSSSTVDAPAAPARSHRRGRRAFAAVGVVLALGLAAGACTSPEEDYGVSLVNQARIQAHVGQLNRNVSLVLIAQAWSQHLAQAGGLSHRNPLSDGAPAGWRKLGENVGFGGSVDIVEGAFLNSPPHRANILDSSFNNVGVGITVDGNGRRWVVQEFAAL